MEILDPALQAYLDSHCDPEPEALQQINRETYLKVLKPHMLSGHYQGRLLSMLSKMIQPKLILEIGTYTGYSAVCLAEGLAEEGVLHTIEANSELEEMLNSHFKSTNVDKKIRLHIGPAEAVMADLELNNIDIVFIDADKRNNFRYFELILDKVRPGGLIIIDNVLWKGKVFGNHNDADTVNIRKLNERIAVNTQVEKLILPVRDGILIIRKK
ncbi:O-methyltransferase [Mucilaginibacter phyllosphaerae]|uniref:O-methyltransferase n=1 Tax=Mucilaginibacter phyllosphaerae TaxID=1812349 RepID=A0A4Y8AEH6_9SPHI|nr:O-methyltransferase [Mucilaginibacter phyllosphaerae]MBB3970160.1 putative O-methyltransferase YrrM [Mucilaginibacter phyllosphaerae]TEW66545.1 O-methyltransferase [Mucilaginibacter phyllosphaerae]GGH10178.1 O-methyltransferase [Mucilaginibacter phyllosphaerae]